MRTTDELVGEVTRRLRAALRPSSQVILFGSRARGDERPDSDIDLLIVEPGVDPNRLDEVIRLQDAAGHGELGVRVEVVPATPEEWERKRLWPGSVYRRAEREGRVILRVP